MPLPTGLTALERVGDYDVMPSSETSPMNKPPSLPPSLPPSSRLLPASPPSAVPPSTSAYRLPDDAQMRRWLTLRHDLADLHARLEYLRLLVSLGVRQIG